MLGRRGVVFCSAMARWTVATAVRIAPARLRRFARREDGSGAVEFALVLLPFLSVMLMTMETALVFFAQQNLETVAADSARLIMTGQAQSQNFDASKFKSAVCKEVVALFNCSTGMYVDVQKYTSFASVSNTVTLDGSGNPVTTYNPGGKNEIVVVRLMYKWPIVSPLTQPYLADGGNSTTRLLVATSAFRNEPF